VHPEPAPDESPEQPEPEEESPEQPSPPPEGEEESPEQLSPPPEEDEESPEQPSPLELDDESPEQPSLDLEDEEELPEQPSFDCEEEEFPEQPLSPFPEGTGLGRGSGWAVGIGGPSLSSGVTGAVTVPLRTGTVEHPVLSMPVARTMG
jgi:hypothetical protein